MTKYVVFHRAESGDWRELGTVEAGSEMAAQPRLRPGEFVEALRAFTRVYEPETYQQALAEKEANAA